MPILRDLKDRITGQSLNQKYNTEASGSVCSAETAALIRRAGAEGAVLLKNENDALPLRQDEKVAVFGRAQNDWFFVGYGSGGNVLSEHRITLMEGLAADGAETDPALKERYARWCEAHAPKKYEWGQWPFSYPEMPISAEDVFAAALRAETALVVIGRCAGEDRDMKLEKGSYRLTDEEEELLLQVTHAFRKTVVVLNTGNLIDLSWMKFYHVQALLVCWQAGQESGLSAADVLTGRVCPSGKLAATWAPAYAYPGMEEFLAEGDANYTEDSYMGYRYLERARENVYYPFGYGLSYTRFSFSPGAFARTDTGLSFTVTVQNTGATPGRETVQLYVRGPRDAPLMLAAYKKTGLLAPGAAETLTLTAENELFAVYDSPSHVFVLKEGEYSVLWGTHAFTEKEAGRFTLTTPVTVKECAPLITGSDFTPPAPCTKPGTPVTFADVTAGRADTDALLASLTDEDLERLSRGEGNMDSPLGVSGNAGVIGGFTDPLREKGLRPLITSDGPAGLRLCVHTSLFPSGTLLACTFDDALVEALMACMGREAKAVGVDIVLGPGLNLQRNPLCGRNFEYYSEDPLLSGRMAAAAVRGIQSAGVSACPKHFCCNNKENGRKYIDSVLSERALRELYLKNFELCLKYSDPLCLMTSYNRINGVSACYNYPLVTGILRREWGFKGLIMTDWWMVYERSAFFPALRDNAARIRAGVNVLMPGNRGRLDKRSHTDPDTLAALRDGRITRAELEQNARYVIELQEKIEAAEGRRGPEAPGVGGQDSGFRG